MTRSGTVLATIAFGAMLVAGTAATAASHGGDGGGRGHGASAGMSSRSEMNEENGFDQSLGRGQTDGAYDTHVTGSCETLYQSYNPRTGTYLGLDGRRHAC